MMVAEGIVEADAVKSEKRRTCPILKTQCLREGCAVWYNDECAFCRSLQAF
jgi:hypothetical protein